MTKTWDEAARELAAPFAPDEIQFRPGMVKGNRASALAFVDARAVMDRLDEVFGVEGWSDEYTVLADGSVTCRLKCLLAGRSVTKQDVGSPSEQPDGGDRMKAAYSDALKRVAVKFGVGRYLYNLPSQWCDYDPAKRTFVRKPTLPDWALPRPAPAPAAKPAPAAVASPIVQGVRKSLARIAHVYGKAPADEEAKLLVHLGASSFDALTEKQLAEADSMVKAKLDLANNLAAVREILDEEAEDWEQIRDNPELAKLNVQGKQLVDLGPGPMRELLAFLRKAREMRVRINL